MSGSVVFEGKGDITTRYEVGEVELNPSPKDFRLYILVTRDEGGTYSAVVTNLPGAGSCGDTEDEAIENAKEATRAAIESYRESGEGIPWRNPVVNGALADGKLHKVILNA